MKEFTRKLVTFDKNCELLLIHIHHLNKKGKMRICQASTKFLAKSIGKSERQTYRYLKALEEKNLIERATTPLKTQYIEGVRTKYRHRKISVKSVESPFTNTILNIYFDKNLNEEQKLEATKKVVKSDNFATVNIENSKIKEIDLIKLNKMVIEKMGTEDYDHTEEMVFFPKKKIPDEMKKEIELAEELLRQEQFGENEVLKRYNKEVNEEASKYLRLANSNNLPIEGDDALEKAVTIALNDFKESEELCPSSLEEIEMKVSAMIDNVTFENNEYFIEIMVAGTIPHRIKLLEYLPEGKESPFYPVFEKFFKNKVS